MQAQIIDSLNPLANVEGADDMHLNNSEIKIAQLTSTIFFY